MNNANNLSGSSAEAGGAYIPASQTLPEITLKAVILSIVITIILAASNAYLALKVGTTISASIPAAVMAMGVLRFFKRSNILESNIVQTAASAGEALVATIAFILPALLIIGMWTDFNYVETVSITVIGGILGVFFSIPLRRVFLPDKTLSFPEGTAIGNVLKASADNTASLKYLTRGGLVGGLISLAQTGFKTVADSTAAWFSNKGLVAGIGLGFSPALIAAGYIVGITVGVSVLIGIILGWLIGVPYLSAHSPEIQGDAATIGMTVWKTQIRYIGVGTMLIGGFWTLIKLMKQLTEGVRSSIIALKAVKHAGLAAIPRTERDIPINYIFWGSILLIIPMFCLYWFYTTPAALGISTAHQIFLILAAIAYTYTAGFIFASISGYFTGLVGATNNPVSALILGALMLISLLVLIIVGATHLGAIAEHNMAAAAFSIIIVALVASAATITCETMQDLKAGEMVGATPWKQQVMLIIGVVAASVVIPLILKLLFNAYGISGVFPRPGMDPSQMLAAPQASAMAVVVQGVFAHQLPWTMLSIGAVIAVICLTIDYYLRQRGYSLPVLGVALGIYLPFDVTTPIVLGAFASYFIKRVFQKRYPANQELAAKANQRGLILACGLVAGAALMGVMLAVPFAISQSTDVLRLVSPQFEPIAEGLGFILSLGLVAWFYHAVCKDK